MHTVLSLTTILAQSGGMRDVGNRGAFSDIGAQISGLVDLLLTPFGLASVMFGVGVFALLITSRGGTIIIGGLTVFLLSMMRSDSKWVDNTLIGPLEAVRNFSRPAAFALLFLLALRTLAFPRGDRRRMLVAPALCFLAFELYYITMVGAFIDPFRGIFGVFCYLAAFFGFTYGFPSLMQDERTSQNLLKVFGIGALLFIGANLLQLTGGYYSAVNQGRFIGIAGNPQQMAISCCLYLCVGCFFFASSPAGSLTKWLAAISMGILGLFILWSGSRTGAICATIAIVAFFRAKISRLAVLGLVGGAAFGIAITVFSDSLFIVERFVRGGDTRTEVWISALEDFMLTPVFGQIPAGNEDVINFAESTYLRTLSQLGAVGALLLAPVLLSWMSLTLRTWRMGRAVPALAAHADFVVCTAACFLVMNLGEGVMMGVLTLFIPFFYAVWATAAFVLETGEQELERQAELEDSGGGEETGEDFDDGDADAYASGHGPVGAQAVYRD